MPVEFTPKSKIPDEGFWANMRENVWMAIIDNETSERCFAKKICSDFVVVLSGDIAITEYQYMPYSYSFLNYLEEGTLVFSANIGPNGEAKDA